MAFLLHKWPVPGDEEDDNALDNHHETDIAVQSYVSDAIVDVAAEGIPMFGRKEIRLVQLH